MGEGLNATESNRIKITVRAIFTYMCKPYLVCTYSTILITSPLWARENVSFKYRHNHHFLDHSEKVDSKGRMARLSSSRALPTRLPALRLALLLLAFVLPLSVSGMNEKSAAFLAENANKPGVVTLPSGLQYKVLKKGEGGEHPTADSPCLCHYEGTLIDGTKFDSSYDRGDPTAFAPNQVSLEPPPPPPHRAARSGSNPSPGIAQT